MSEGFKITLNVTQKDWCYLQIPYRYANLFPDGKFKIIFNGETFESRLSKAKRIVKKSLVKKMASTRYSDFLVTKKSDKEFVITGLANRV